MRFPGNCPPEKPEATEATRAGRPRVRNHALRFATLIRPRCKSSSVSDKLAANDACTKHAVPRLIGGKPIEQDIAVSLGRIETRRWKIGLVGCVGKELRFKDERIALPISVSGFADDRAIEKIARVELQSWLRREEFQNTSGHRILDARDEPR